MILKSLSLIILLVACSSKKVPDANEYLKLHQQHKKLHRACLQHRDNVLVKAITESEHADLDDEQYYFVRNEKTALKYIEAFDVHKFTLKENQQEYQALVDACVQERNPAHKTCDTLYPAFKFFRGLIHGMNQYGWSSETKQKGVGITLSYLRYVGESQSSFMDVLFANDLLSRLVRRGYVKSDILDETIELRRDAEMSYQKLMDNLRKLGKRDLSCDETRDFYAKERANVKELSERFLTLLSRVKV